jgi:hypothetical protein
MKSGPFGRPPSMRRRSRRAISPRVARESHLSGRAQEATWKRRRTRRCEAPKVPRQKTIYLRAAIHCGAREARSRRTGELAISAALPAACSPARGRRSSRSTKRKLRSKRVGTRAVHIARRRMLGGRPNGNRRKGATWKWIDSGGGGAAQLAAPGSHGAVRSVQSSET